MAVYFSFDPATDPQAIMIEGPPDKLPVQSLALPGQTALQTEAQALQDSGGGATSTFDLGGLPLVRPLSLPSLDLTHVNPSWVILGGMGAIAIAALMRPAPAPPSRRRR